MLSKELLRSRTGNQAWALVVLMGSEDVDSELGKLLFSAGSIWS